MGNEWTDYISKSFKPWDGIYLCPMSDDSIGKDQLKTIGYRLLADISQKYPGVTDDGRIIYWDDTAAPFPSLIRLAVNKDLLSECMEKCHTEADFDKRFKKEFDDIKSSGKLIIENTKVGMGLFTDSGYVLSDKVYADLSTDERKEKNVELFNSLMENISKEYYRIAEKAREEGLAWESIVDEINKKPEEKAKGKLTLDDYMPPKGTLETTWDITPYLREKGLYNDDDGVEYCRELLRLYKESGGKLCDCPLNIMDKAREHGMFIHQKDFDSIALEMRDAMETFGDDRPYNNKEHFLIFEKEDTKVK